MKVCDFLRYAMAKISSISSTFSVDTFATHSNRHSLLQATNENDYEFVKSDNCHLDECNMAEKDGEMAYFISTNWPYVPPCLKGQLFDIYQLNMTNT